MKTTIILLSLSFFSIFLNAQHLTPLDLVQIHGIKQAEDVSLRLNLIGYKKGHVSKISDGTNLFNWHFQTRLGEVSDLTVSRIADSTGIRESRYLIKNVYQYRQFVDGLKKLKYQFKGLRIESGEISMVFTRKNLSFLLSERPGAKGEIYYIIRLQATEKVPFAGKDIYARR